MPPTDLNCYISHNLRNIKKFHFLNKIMSEEERMMGSFFPCIKITNTNFPTIYKLVSQIISMLKGLGTEY